MLSDCDPWLHLQDDPVGDGLTCMTETPDIKLFGKWSTDDVQINDISLKITLQWRRIVSTTCPAAQGTMQPSASERHGALLWRASPTQWWYTAIMMANSSWPCPLASILLRSSIRSLVRNHTPLPDPTGPGACHYAQWFWKDSTHTRWTRIVKLLAIICPHYAVWIGPSGCCAQMSVGPPSGTSRPLLSIQQMSSSVKPRALPIPVLSRNTSWKVYSSSTTDHLALAPINRSVHPSLGGSKNLSLFWENSLE